jgi:Na+/H+-dicarboxylate symporter
MPRFDLTRKVIIGFIAGIAAGLVFGDRCAILHPISNIFMNLWEMTILPALIISLIAGVGSLKQSHARDIVIRAGLVLLAIWTIGVASSFAMQLAFPPLDRAFFFSTTDLAQPEDFNYIEAFIPYNPFHSLSQGLFSAVIIFCLLIGFALIGDRNKSSLLSLFDNLSNVFLRMTDILSRSQFSIKQHWWA